MVKKSKNMKRYKLYLFDLDGTLIDSDQMLIETFRELYSIHRPDYHPSDDYIRTFSGPPIAETLQKEFPMLDQNAILAEYKERSRKFYDKCVHLFPNAIDVIEKLHKNNIPFGVITNKHRYATIYTYGILDLEKYNIYSVCADDVKHLKPHEEGILKAMYDFGIKNKDDVIYIGDSTFDYLSASNAGVKFGYVAWSPRVIKGQVKIDEIIQSYAEFAKEI